jgi:hypothetical protein
MSPATDTAAPETARPDAPADTPVLERPWS